MLSNPCRCCQSFFWIIHAFFYTWSSWITWHFFTVIFFASIGPALRTKNISFAFVLSGIPPINPADFNIVICASFSGQICITALAPTAKHKYNSANKNICNHCHGWWELLSTLQSHCKTEILVAPSMRPGQNAKPWPISGAIDLLLYYLWYNIHHGLWNIYSNPVLSIFSQTLSTQAWTASNVNLSITEYCQLWVVPRVLKLAVTRWTEHYLFEKILRLQLAYYTLLQICLVNVYTTI